MYGMYSTEMCILLSFFFLYRAKCSVIKLRQSNQKRKLSVLLKDPSPSLTNVRFPNWWAGQRLWEWCSNRQPTRSTTYRSGSMLNFGMPSTPLVVSSSVKHTKDQWSQMYFSAVRVNINIYSVCVYVRGGESASLWFQTFLLDSKATEMMCKVLYQHIPFRLCRLNKLAAVS